MFKKITMTIPLCPVTKKNSQRIIQRYMPSKGKSVPVIIPSAKYVEYEKAAGYFIRPKGIKINYPVNIEAKYYMPTRRRVDLTNLHEALHDMLVKYEVLEDDNYRIIAATDGSRVYVDKDNPRTEITITVMEDENESM